MRKLVLDFETYYDTNVNLKKINTIAYVNHPDFKVWGVGAKFLEDDSKSVSDQVAMRLGALPAGWYGADDAEDFIRSIDWENTEVICHNVNFDGFILTQYYGVTPAKFTCTASMSRALFPNSSASLDAVSRRLFGGDDDMVKGDALPKAKGVVNLPPDLEKEIAEYCVQDVKLTEEIYKEFMKRGFPESELELIDLTTRMFVLPTLVADVPRLEAFYRSEKERAENTIKASGVDKKVLSSNKQFAEHLESIGLTVPKKTSPSTGKRIPALGQKDFGYKNLMADHPEHKKLWDAREAAKSRIQETRAMRFITAVLNDGTIPMPLRYYGAHTGRFSGGESMNVQNMPRGSELRLSLTAPEDQLVYVIDLSQIEARMLAWLAGEESILRVFRDKGDVYCAFGSIVYNMPINKTDHKEERFVAKTAVLGLGYGLGFNRFHEMMNIGAMGPAVVMSRQEAQRIVTTYRNTYSRIPVFWKRCTELIYDMCDPSKVGTKYGPLTIGHEKLIMPNGLALEYPGLRKHNGEGYDGRNGFIKLYGGKLAENITQALARIVITDALLRVQEYIKPLGGNVVLTVHDELVILGPKENADKHMERIHELTVQNPTWCLDLPLEAEGGYAKEYSK